MYFRNIRSIETGKVKGGKTATFTEHRPHSLNIFSVEFGKVKGNKTAATVKHTVHIHNILSVQIFLHSHNDCQIATFAKPRCTTCRTIGSKRIIEDYFCDLFCDIVPFVIPISPHSIRAFGLVFIEVECESAGFVDKNGVGYSVLLTDTGEVSRSGFTAINAGVGGVNEVVGVGSIFAANKGGAGSEHMI
jgi:hypothetical protein